LKIHGKSRFFQINLEGLNKRFICVTSGFTEDPLANPGNMPNKFAKNTAIGPGKRGLEPDPSKERKNSWAGRPCHGMNFLLK
jgi:hypothetical protein